MAGDQAFALSLPDSSTQSRGMYGLCGMLPPGVTWGSPSPSHPKYLGLQRRICRGWRCMCSSLTSDETWGQRTPSLTWMMHSMLRELHLPDRNQKRALECESQSRTAIIEITAGAMPAPKQRAHGSCRRPPCHTNRWFALLVDAQSSYDAPCFK